MLSDLDRAVLDFEQTWWQHPGSKERAIKVRFGMSATRYYQHLTRLIDRPEVLAAEPLLVRRLRRLRVARTRGRAAQG